MHTYDNVMECTHLQYIAGVCIPSHYHMCALYCRCVHSITLSHVCIILQVCAFHHIIICVHYIAGVCIPSHYHKCALYCRCVHSITLSHVCIILQVCAFHHIITCVHYIAG